MAVFGQGNEQYERILFIAFAILSAICFLVQLYFIKFLKILPIYLLPFISACICYVSIIFYYGSSLSNLSNAVFCGKICHSLIIPLLCFVEYEISFRLHEAKGTYFCGIRFDEGNSRMTSVISLIILWGMRFIVIGIFIMNVFVFFDLVDNTFFGGYVTLSIHPNSLGLWLQLIPPTYLALLSFFVSIVMYSFGNNQTLSFGYNRRWRLLGPCTVAHCVGQIFDHVVYPVTSLAGLLVLLMGVTNAAYLIQQELILAGSFATYLHKSNLAFEPDLSPQLPITSEAPPRTPDRSYLYVDKSSAEIVTPQHDHGIV